MSGCDIDLFEKRPCPFLPKCENRYIGSFNPFDVDSMSGISTPWLGTGLESKSYSYKGSAAEVPSHPYQSSHIYGYTNKRKQPQHTYSDPYSHPYGTSYTYDTSLSDQSAQLVAAEELPVSQSLNAPMQDQANDDDLLSLGGTDPNCELSQWGDWSDCSSPCDSGSRTRNRRYINPESSLDCVEDLFDHQPCRGNAANCPPPREPMGTPDFEQPQVTGLGFGSYMTNVGSQDADDPACQTTNWSDWSPCSSKCGSGYQRRTRFYTIPFVPNRSCDVRLYDKQDCYGQDPSCDGYSSYSYSKWL